MMVSYVDRRVCYTLYLFSFTRIAMSYAPYLEGLTFARFLCVRHSRSLWHVPYSLTSCAHAEAYLGLGEKKSLKSNSLKVVRHQGFCRMQFGIMTVSSSSRRLSKGMIHQSWFSSKKSQGLFIELLAVVVKHHRSSNTSKWKNVSIMIVEQMFAKSFHSTTYRRR